MPKKNLNAKDIRAIKDIATKLMQDFPVNYLKLPEFQGNSEPQTYCFAMATIQYLYKKEVLKEPLTYKTKYYIIE